MTIEKLVDAERRLSDVTNRVQALEGSLGNTQQLAIAGAIEAYEGVVPSAIATAIAPVQADADAAATLAAQALAAAADAKANPTLTSAKIVAAGGDTTARAGLALFQTGDMPALGSAFSQAGTVYPATLPTNVNDNALLLDFFNRANGKVGVLPPGTFRLTSKLTFALPNSVITGVPGKTIIRGDFGHNMVRLSDCVKVRFYGITFQNEYVNAVEDQGSGVVWSQGNELSEVIFEECTWTAPNAHTNAVKFNASTSTGGLSAARVYRNIIFRRCKFIDIGRMPIEVINHLHDGVSRYFDIVIDDCVFQNTGLFGLYGQVSFSGLGTAKVTRCVIDNPYLIGIEFAGSYGGVVDDIVFRNVTRPTALIGTSDGRNTEPVTGLTVSNIRTEGYQSGASISLGQTVDSLLDNIQCDIGGYINVFGSTRLRIDRSVIKCHGIYGVLNGLATVTVNGVDVIIPTTGTIVDRTTVDCSAATGGFNSVIRCDGAGVTGNRIRRSKVIRPGTGGRLSNANGATRNWMEETDYDTAIWSSATFLVTMTNATYQVTAEIGQYPVVEFRGTLTADQIVFWDAGPDKTVTVRNATVGGFSLSIRPFSGNTGVTVANGQTTMLALRNASLDAVRIGNFA